MQTRWSQEPGFTRYLQILVPEHIHVFLHFRALGGVNRHFNAFQSIRNKKLCRFINSKCQTDDSGTISWKITTHQWEGGSPQGARGSPGGPRYIGNYMESDPFWFHFDFIFDFLVVSIDILMHTNRFAIKSYVDLSFQNVKRTILDSFREILAKILEICWP